MTDDDDNEEALDGKGNPGMNEYNWKLFELFIF